VDEKILVAIIAVFGALGAGILALIGSLIGYLISNKHFKTNRTDKYVFAALDKKLAAHQEAFDLSYELTSIAHDETNEKYDYIEKCQS
jgi:hypothetical protein